MKIVTLKKSQQNIAKSSQNADATITDIAANAPELKARREAVTMLEKLTGTPEALAASIVRLRRNLMAGSIAVGSVTLLTALPGHGLVQASIALGLAIGLAQGSETLICAARQAWQRKGMERREGLRCLVFQIPQVCGMTLACVTLGASGIYMAGLLMMIALAAYAGWSGGAQGLRAMQLRMEVESARSGLANAEADFERKLTTAKTAFEAQIARLRREAGAVSPPPETIAAE